MSVMLYKYPASNKNTNNFMHGDHFDYIIVNENEVETTLKDGWSLTTDEAKKPKEQPKPKTVLKRTRKKKDELD